MTSNSSFFNVYRAAERPNPQEAFWLVRLVQRLLGILLLGLLINLAIVGFRPDGVELLGTAFEQESVYLGLGDGSRASQFLAGTVATVDEWYWVRSGLAAQLRSSDAAITSALWQFLVGLSIGLKLFALRIGVLALMSPLILMGMMAAVGDGFAAWYIRRTSAGRESAFIYHRAKRLTGWSLFGLLGLYLLPPFAIDPRWILPPFLLLIAISVRVTAQSFKKYL